MKRLGVALALIAVMLLSGVALADDPLEVKIESEGDIDANLEAKGDMNLKIESGGDIFLNDDGLATKDELVEATASSGVRAYEDFVCGGSRMAIKGINRLLDRQALIIDGLELEITLLKERVEEIEQQLSKLTK